MLSATQECLAVQSAYVALCNGDPVMANYMVRDLWVTNAAGLKDLSWAMDKEGASSGEVRDLLDKISEHMIPGGPSTIEGVGLAVRLGDVGDMIRGQDPTSDVRELLMAEATRLIERLREVTDG